MFDTERNQPMRVCGFAHLATQVRHCERNVDQPHAELPRLLEFRVRHKGGPNGWRDAAMPPCDDPPLRIQPRVEAFG